MTKSIAVMLCAVMASAALVAASVEDVFSDADGARIREALTGAQKDGWWGSARRSHYAVASLLALNSAVPSRDKVCAALARVVSSNPSSVEELYHAVAGAEKLACENVPISAATKTTIQSGLSADSLDSILFALQTIEAAAARKHLSVADFDVTTVASRVMDLAEDDDSALFRANSDADDATAVNAGRAMQVLGGVYRARHELDNSLAGHVRAVSGSKLKNLLAAGTAKGVDFTAGSDVSGLVAASTVLQGVNALASALSEQLNVPEFAVDDVCDFLVENKYASALDDVYHLLTGLQICANNNLRVPLVVTVVPPTGKAAGGVPTQVRVTNVFDRFATKAKVVLAKAQTDSDDDDAAVATVADSVELSAATSAADNVVYNLPSAATAKAWPANFYLLKFVVTPSSSAEQFKAERVSRRIKVSASYAPSKVDLFTSDSAKGAADGKTETVSYASSGPTVTATAGKFFHARVHFNPPTARPAQVFVILTPLHDTKGPRKQSIHVTNVADGADYYALKLDLGSAEVADSLSGNGKYSVELFVGDALLAKPVSWRMATLDVTGLPAAAAGASTVASKNAAVDWFAAKPEIAHAFRPAEERPSKLLALVFTAAALVPLGLLVVRVLTSGGVTTQLPSDPAELMSALLFHGLLAAILATNVVYWLGLNIFQALILLGMLAPFTVFFGHRSLKALHIRKQKERQSAAAAAAVGSS